MSNPDLSGILQELAAGRIDAAEAARRIDRAQTTSTPPSAPPLEAPSAPAAAPAPAPAAAAAPAPVPAAPAAADAPHAPTSPAGPEAPAPEEPWAAASDRPQRATHTRETILPPEPEPESAPPESAPPESESESTVGPSRPGPAGRPAASGGVERITVRAVGRRVRIVGETSVATLSADGPHVLRRNGSVLEVSSDGEIGASLDGFSILKAPRSLDDFRSLGLGKELFLRVNPAIVVDVEVTAGSLHTEGVPHLGKVRVTAGGAKLLDVAEVNDALIQAGQATIKGALVSGRSRIRAESGSLSIALADSSDVTITSDAQLGKVSWAGQHTGAGDEVVMGSGSARLVVEVVMGHAQVRVGTETPETAGTP